MYNSSSVNKVILLGFVFNEPRWYVLNHNKVYTFTLVTREMFKKNGQSVNHEEWHQIRVPEELMTDDTVVEKGMQIYIQGKLQTRQIKDENGIKHYRSEIIAGAIEVMKFS